MNFMNDILFWMGFFTIYHITLIFVYVSYASVVAQGNALRTMAASYGKSLNWALHRNHTPSHI